MHATQSLPPIQAMSRVYCGHKMRNRKELTLITLTHIYNLITLIHIYKTDDKLWTMSRVYSGTGSAESQQAEVGNGRADWIGRQRVVSRQRSATGEQTGSAGRE